MITLLINLRELNLQESNRKILIQHQKIIKKRDRKGINLRQSAICDHSRIKNLTK